MATPYIISRMVLNNNEKKTFYSGILLTAIFGLSASLFLSGIYIYFLLTAKSSSLVVNILGSIMVFSLSIFMFIHGLISIELVVISPSGITYKNAFIRTEEIPWTSIQKVYLDETFVEYKHGQCGISMKAIMIQVKENAPHYIRKFLMYEPKPNCPIKYTKKSLSIMKEYCKKYCSKDAIIDL